MFHSTLDKIVSTIATTNQHCAGAEQALRSKVTTDSTIYQWSSVCANVHLSKGRLL